MVEGRKRGVSTYVREGEELTEEEEFRTPPPPPPPPTRGDSESHMRRRSP